MKKLLVAFLLVMAMSLGAYADYLGAWAIDDYLTITATTHRFSTGAAYAASPITYTIYEANNPTEIVSATGMSNFDSETGLYIAYVQLTSGVGYENGKQYIVLIKGTVDSVAAIQTHNFQILARTDAKLVNGATPMDGPTLAGYVDDSSADVNTLVTFAALWDTTNEARTILTGGTSALSTLGTSDNIGINWNDVSNPTSTVALTNTTIDLVSGAVSGVVSETFADSNWTAVATNIDDIETDSNSLQEDWANGGRLDNLLDSAAAAGSVDFNDLGNLDITSFSTEDTWGWILNRILNVADSKR